MSELNISDLIEQLADPDETVNQGAAIELIDIGEPAVDALLETLDNIDGQVRYLSAWVLGEIGDTRAVEPLIEALHDSDPRVRDWAAKALGEMHDERAIQPLIKVLLDEHVGARRNAASRVPGWR